jgi:hypothetical protein
MAVDRPTPFKGYEPFDAKRYDVKNPDLLEERKLGINV